MRRELPVQAPEQLTVEDLPDDVDESQLNKTSTRFRFTLRKGADMDLGADLDAESASASDIFAASALSRVKQQGMHV